MNIYTPRLIYYVYAYLRKDGTPYYIGKGKENRVWSKQHMVPLPEDNKKIVIVEANLTEIGAFALERRLICWYGRKDNGTGILRNLTDGGEGVSGRILSTESRLKISEAKKGHLFSEEHKLKMSESLKGRTLSNETKLKMSIAAKGHILSEETKLKMSISRKGFKHSEETKLKISKSNKGEKSWMFGKKFSPETRLKMSEAQKGRTLSEETKLKISIAKKSSIFKNHN
jgi:hypothetical protein